MISSFFFFFFRFFRPFPLPPPLCYFYFYFFLFFWDLWKYGWRLKSRLSPGPTDWSGLITSSFVLHVITQPAAFFSLFFFCLDCLHTTVIYIYIYSKVYILFIHFYRFFPRFSSFSSNDYYLPSSRFVFSFFPLLLLLLSSHILIFS
jgi:hypothetical protein